MSHICGHNEKQAYILDAWYAQQFQEAFGYGSTNCCGQFLTFPSFIPSDFYGTSYEDVRDNFTSFMNQTLDGGEWHLTECSAPRVTS